MRRLSLVVMSMLLAVLFTACTEPDKAPTAQTNAAPAPAAPTPIAVESAVARIAAGPVAPLWPGFDPRTIPLAIYDGRQTWLFRHPTPPKGYVRGPAEAGTQVWVMPGRDAAISANTSTELGGVPTGTLMLDAKSDRGVDAWAAIAIHEAFHVHQRAHHAGWIGNEADLFTYPIDSDTWLAQRRLETRALANALDAADKNESACWTRAALALRKQRYEAMDPVYPAYERGTELNEGLAAYVQLRAEGQHTIAVPAEGFGPAQVRQRAYVTGPALALLMDQHAGAGWRDAFEKNDKQTLDGALSEALGSGRTCAFPSDAVAQATQAARRDIAALHADQAKRLSAFRAAPGWRVIVEAAEGQPLWPQGFDPLNVERVGPTTVLHTRMVKVGNDAGAIEVLGAQAMTEGVGPHPLFQGVRRIEVVGLPEVRVEEAENEARVSGDGVTLVFKDAGVNSRGRVVLVRMSH